MRWFSIFKHLIRMNQYQCILCSSTGFFASRINMFSQLCWIFCTNADLCQRAALGWSVQNEKNYPFGRIMGFIFIISCNKGKFVKKKKNSLTMDDEYSQQISWLLVSLTSVVKQDGHAQPNYLQCHA